MADINRETIKNLSRLCRIDCTEEEIESLQKDLKRIVAYIEQLQEIDTENVPPCNHVLDDIFNVMRDDETGPSMDRDFFLSNAPAHIGGLVRVPTVIKQQN
jgi:aspartyl-tRNA(Asn)/glutamyl-tRNA(Gln) amidotransferase subunit C